MDVAQVLLGWTTTASPSYATGSSRYEMPADRQASISLREIGRDAFEITVSPRQNFWNPPPVPESPTVTRCPAFCFWNSSATASVIGNTVLEPSIAMTAGAPEPP